MDSKNISRNTKIFSLVASVLLLSLFIGASFAYFGSFNQNVTSKVKVNVTIDVGAEGTFVSDGADFNLTVPNKNMTQYVESGVAAREGSYLNVTLTSGSDKIRTTCTYDIVFEYDSSSSFYGISPTPVTTGADKELTLQVLGIDAKGDFVEEKNFNYETTSGKWSNASKPKRVIISGATISDASTRGTTQTYGISTKFYNLDVNQSALAGKTFSGTFYVDESSVVCDNESYSKESLYSKIEQRYKNNDTYVKLYNESDTSSYSHPVYYFNGAVEDNNVLFAGFCWKIVRTTDTGGVKMIYNGVQTNGSCNNTGDASQLASTKAFNSSYNSPAYVGYMYNTVYQYSYNYIISSTSFSGSKIVGDSVTYSGSTYTLNNTSTVSVSSSNISEMVGKYTCNSSSATLCLSPYYIVGYSGTTIYYYSLSGGNTDGTSYIKDYVFGNSFTYANGTYTLSDTITINSNNWSTKYNTISSNHYTCFTTGTTCTSLYYVYYTSPSTAYYITLTNGKSVEDAINEMLYADDVNTKDSTMKAYIDSWYKENMTSYTDKLEDTVFCNDRTMRNQSANGWNPNGGSTTTLLYFKNYSTNYSLACTNETDRFSMSNSKAKLTYPVGLLSAPEARLAQRNTSSSTFYLKNGNEYWLASPNYVNNGHAYGRSVYTSGDMYNSSGVHSAYGVRPSISLKPGTGYISGDGSYTNPFVVE